MKIGKVTRTTIDPYPALRVEIDGKDALFSPLDLKRTLLDEYGIVYLGPDFEKDHKVILPADSSDSRSTMTLQGFTSDLTLVGIIRDWLRDLDNAK